MVGRRVRADQESYDMAAPSTSRRLAAADYLALGRLGAEVGSTQGERAG